MVTGKKYLEVELSSLSLCASPPMSDAYEEGGTKQHNDQTVVDHMMALPHKTTDARTSEAEARAKSWDWEILLCEHTWVYRK